MTVDICAADYCPTCGQPRDIAPGPVERFGLTLRGYLLCFGDARIRLRPGVAKLARLLIERGSAAHELITLRVCPEATSNMRNVYARFLRDALEKVTGGAIVMNTIWGWGYELAEADAERSAA